MTKLTYFLFVGSLYKWSKILKWVALGVVIWSMIVVLIYLICPCDANAADHAIVSFNDADHLAALQDSVVGVCDTIMPYKVDSMYVVYPGSNVDFTPYYVGWINGVDSLDWQVWQMTITCRRLVGVTVTEQTRTIPNAEHESVYTWERPLPYHVFDPPDSVKEAEWRKLNDEWLDKLSRTPEFTTIPGEAIIWYELYEEVRQ